MDLWLLYDGNKVRELRTHYVVLSHCLLYTTMQND